MAWRIDEQVVRGEIDNRARDRVTGRIWFTGSDTPVELELTGNTWRDLAGRRLEFVNPDPRPGDTRSLAPRQVGIIGDCTASRKVKVPEVSDEELMRRFEARQPFPWHWGNSLYLEWFSQTNGRVVIESAAYRLTISPESAWDMTAEEEDAQRVANAEAMQDFVDQLSVLPLEPSPVKPERADTDDASWQSDRPMTEAEAEALQTESDQLVDRIQARIEREGDEADIGRIIEEELERRRAERGEKPLTPEQEAERAAWVDEMNHAAEEAADDPELDELADRKHPLAERAFELTIRLHRETEERGWLRENAGAEHPVLMLVDATSCASAKLAGALNGEEWPPAIEFCAGTIVRLKRGRGYIDDALLAADDCIVQKLADDGWLAKVRSVLEEIGGATDELIAELRAKLERGFD